MLLLKEDSVVNSTTATGSLFQTLVTISEKRSSGSTGVLVLIICMDAP